MRYLDLGILFAFLLTGVTTPGCAGEDDGADTDSGNTIVNNTGVPYVVAGDWRGHAETTTGFTEGGTITALDRDYNLASEQICLSGTTIADYGSLGLFSMNLNQLPGGEVGYWRVNGSYTGVSVNLTLNATSTVNIMLNTEGGGAYCTTLSPGANNLEWSDLISQCWTGNGEGFDGLSPIEKIQIYSVGDSAAATQFDFCIGGLQPIAGSFVVDTDFDTGTPLTVNKFVGNITTGYSHAIDYGGLKFSDYWDQITPENAGKWGSVENTAGGTRVWSSLDAIYAYAQDNNIVFKQHAFVWGSQAPANSATFTETDVKSWMTEFCERYPNTQLIDVVNEPPPHTEPDFVGNIGGGTDADWAWVTNSFIWAREACPNAILILNDYNNIEWPNDNAHFISIAQAIQAAGAPIDALGAQAHDLDNGGVSIGTVKQLLAKMHNDTGLPVYISEFDISTTSDLNQHAKYAEYIPYFLETEYVHGITIWGWVVGQTWSMAPDSGLVEGTSPRPAMTWLMNSLSRPIPAP